MEWIKCSERLPEQNSRVIAYTTYGGVVYDMHYLWDAYPDTVWMTHHSRWGGEVTHWMPLPEPPSE